MVGLSAGYNWFCTVSLLIADSLVELEAGIATFDFDVNGAWRRVCCGRPLSPFADQT